jgi:uncharacterized protein (DUF1501 family)
MSVHNKPDCNACAEYNELSRREFLARSTMAAAVLSAPAWLPQVAYAQTEDTSRDVIVFVFLRGGADGLSIVPPYAENAYYTLRPGLAIRRPDDASVVAANRAVDLNGFFGLAPAMGSLLPAYQAGHLLVIHAAGSSDPTRSHFDAQAFMEVGVPGARDVETGWLARHLVSKPPMKPNAALRALAFNYGLPLMLAGAPDTLPIPNPANFALSGSSSTASQRLAWLGTSFAGQIDPLRASALNTQRTITELAAINIGTYQPSGGVVYPTSSFGTALRSTAALIRADVGVEAVQIDYGGWDTHNAQGPVTGGMATTMRTLADAIAAFHTDMVGANRLGRLTMVVMSEFGRRAAENASQGTDHGHGNVMFVMGGSTVGGRVLSQWPGLSAQQLYQGQDVQVTIDYRDILSEIVSRRLGNTQLDVVFPGYAPTFRGAVV